MADRHLDRVDAVLDEGGGQFEIRFCKNLLLGPAREQEHYFVAGSDHATILGCCANPLAKKDKKAA